MKKLLAKTVLGFLISLAVVADHILALDTAVAILTLLAVTAVSTSIICLVFWSVDVLIED